ncbi:hypothetical protein [uncultured Alsobacter sp.]|uniref:hypothetical protein n=1 Tax=uncultured Alsobacter sp. TaxID=1748258 RepID=UPI0025FB6523|nr:hypothetical protein [uncultured Alsobacter sp.]
MRIGVTVAATLFSMASSVACEIGPQANVPLEPKDQAVLVALGKHIGAPALFKGAPVASLFATPPAALTLSAADGKAVAQALSGLRKVTACGADGIPMQRILEDNTPGIRFLRLLEECLADACVDNK